jgi:hypothetical protein
VLEAAGELKPNEPVTVYVDGTETPQSLRHLAKRAVEDQRAITLQDVATGAKRTIEPGTRPGMAIVEDEALAKTLGDVQLRIRTAPENIAGEIAKARFPVIELEASPKAKAQAIAAIEAQLGKNGPPVEIRVGGEFVARVDGRSVTVGELKAHPDRAAACSLLRAALWTGHGDSVVIAGAGTFGAGQRISGTLASSREYAVEAFAHQTARAAGARNANDAVAVQLREIYTRAMQEAATSKVSNAEGMRGAGWVGTWTALTIELSAAAEASPQLVRNVIGKIVEHSAKSFDQNALDFVRIAGSGENQVTTALGHINDLLGTDGSVHVLGSVPRMAHDAVIANERPAQHELESFQRLKSSFRDRIGKTYELTALTTDSTGGLRQASTPDFMLVEHVAGRPRRQLSMDAKNVDARHFDATNTDIPKGIKQVRAGMEKGTAGDPKGLIIVNLYNAPLERTRLLESVRTLMENQRPRDQRIFVEVVFGKNERYILNPDTGWKATKNASLPGELGWN